MRQTVDYDVARECLAKMPESTVARYLQAVYGSYVSEIQKVWNWTSAQVIWLNLLTEQTGSCIKDNWRRDPHFYRPPLTGWRSSVRDATIWQYRGAPHNQG